MIPSSKLEYVARSDLKVKKKKRKKERKKKRILVF